ncbi:hypothetical protein AMAG_14670 [Allomyces macrogynus ATCC 38327]|uniref:Uncharacterized protein n=1 Tax=Allomyces macrogynus (strain ATCC 38327) TaxID=578462 RepID=A0A0L0T6X7_ALLM3|nr:hypothetical protein AMAG_14670 [Allomyces macrogynus ATCC 38327]|eukprot:KNE70548.1 hypothetical protein AMAG_14670 [Allomyces macrogynus ATCC 38327]
MMRPVSAPSGRRAARYRAPSDSQHAPLPPPPPPLRAVASSTRLLLPFSAARVPLLPRSPTSADGATSSSSSSGQSRWLDQFLLVKGLGVLALVVGSDEVVDALLLDLVHPVAPDEDAQRAAINDLHVQVFTWLAAFHAEQWALHTHATGSTAGKRRPVSAASAASRPASAPAGRGNRVPPADPPRTFDREQVRDVVHDLVHAVVTAQQDDAEGPVLDLLVDEYRVPLHAFSEHDILAERDAMCTNYPELCRTLELDLDLDLDLREVQSPSADGPPRDFGLEKIMLAVTADPSNPSSSSSPPSAAHSPPSTHHKYTGLRTARATDATSEPTTPQWATTRDRIAWLQRTYATAPGTAMVAPAPRFHGAEEALLPLGVAAHVRKQVQSPACRVGPPTTRDSRSLVRWDEDAAEQAPVRNSRKYGAWYFPPAQWKAVQGRRAAEVANGRAGSSASGPAGPASSLSKRIHDLETRVAAAHAAQSDLLVPRHARSGTRGVHFANAASFQSMDRLARPRSTTHLSAK